MPRRSMRRCAALRCAMPCCTLLCVLCHGLACACLPHLTLTQYHLLVLASAGAAGCQIPVVKDWVRGPARRSILGACGQVLRDCLRGPARRSMLGMLGNVGRRSVRSRRTGVGLSSRVAFW